MRMFTVIYLQHGACSVRVAMVIPTFQRFRSWDRQKRVEFQCHAWMRFFLFLKMEEKKSPFSKLSGYLCTCGQLRYCSRKGYIATTGTRFTWKKIIQSQRFLKRTDSPAFFANAPITFQKMRAVSREVRYAWLNLEFYCSVCKKNLENL